MNSAESDSLRWKTVEEKGFPCLDKPLPFCLNSAKGTSRKVNIFERFPRLVFTKLIPRYVFLQTIHGYGAIHDGISEILD